MLSTQNALLTNRCGFACAAAAAGWKTPRAAGEERKTQEEKRARKMRASAVRKGSRPVSRGIDDEGVRAVFDWMDSNNDGKISADEFRVGLLGCGFEDEQV